MQRLLSVLVMAAVAGALFAGAQDEGGSQAATAGAADLLGFPRSETLHANIITGRVSAPSNFNEWVGWKNRDRGMQQLMNESLWTSDFINGQGINGLAAGPPEYNSDFTELTVRLREGVYWSDGVELTATDLVYTIELLRDTPGMNFHAVMQEAGNVYAADRYTAVVELTQPNSRFHTYFRDFWGALWVLPKHVFENVDDPLTFEYHPPLSIGPYVLHSFDPEGMWTAWERREDWERTPTGMLYGKPAPRYVVFRHIDETSARVIATVRHEMDSGYMPIESIRAALGASPYARSKRPEFPWAQVGAPTVNGHILNTFRPPFDNREVRWALALSIDIVSLLSVTYDGGAGMSALVVSNVPQYLQQYYAAMEEWLANFTLDLGNGETFQPWDTEAPQRLMEYVTARGYSVPDDPDDIAHVFGVGWWKYAPDAAAKLLEKNGFSRNSEGKWLLPDGTPWRIEILTGTTSGADNYRSAFAGAREWSKFGIDAVAIPTANVGTLGAVGDFDVIASRPVREPWGDHPDLYLSFNQLHSSFVEPQIGERTSGHRSRWSDPRMDAVVADLKVTDWSDTERLVEIGIEGMQILVEEMPAIPLFTLLDLVIWDTYYWENWPGEENAYMVPFHHWPNFKYLLPSLQATGN